MKTSPSLNYVTHLYRYGRRPVAPEFLEKLGDLASWFPEPKYFKKRYRHCVRYVTPTLVVVYQKRRMYAASSWYFKDWRFAKLTPCPDGSVQALAVGYSDPEVQAVFDALSSIEALEALA